MPNETIEVERSGEIALLVVDMQQGFLEAPDEAARRAITNTTMLLDTARAARRPIAFTVQVAPGGPFQHKLPTLARLQPGSEACDIAPELGRRALEQRIEKRAPSAFFETALAEGLRRHGVTTVLLAGTSTSGCVRASAVDAMSSGFTVWVVRDCVFDRDAAAAEMALNDISRKYGEVTSLGHADRMLRRGTSAAERERKRA